VAQQFSPHSPTPCEIEVQTWVAYRDKSRSATEFDQTFHESREDAATTVEANAVMSLVPAEVLGTMTSRVDECWKKFRDVIEPANEYPSS
jgi:hypothetical protein